jgi:hypothetical protein
VVSVIACENTATGDPATDWQVSGAGDATLQGFATSMSVNVGQTVSFKISSTQSAYHIDILRLGYYQGTGARKLVMGLVPSAPFPQTQPACLTTSSTGLIDCGNWGVSASWAVPASAVSGMYIAHLIRNDNGAGSDVPFIVRNDSSHSDIVFQTSDETWQAYNAYGGNSLYQCTVACPPGNPRAYKGAFSVSYNRPFHTALDDGGRDWLTYAEWPMVKYLEANGYDVSYVAAKDVDTGAALLTNHKLFMSTGHDEYWSASQRANVTAARDAGVNLAFFSGNEVFWKTRFEASSDGTSTPQRTVTAYKETHFDAPVDPKDPPTWTGTWEDPRFSPPADGGVPANSLTGQKFIVNSGTTDIKVPSTYASLRLWRNTPVAALTSGQSLTLGAGIGTLGYEWDMDADNGFRPAGLLDLSSTTSTNAEIFTDYGSSTRLNSTATHHLTMYRAPSGALVFGAGTVQWSWGLDNAATGGATDRTMQQATVNLFADMGVQPFSLLAGLVAASQSTDTTPPSSQITSPASGSNLTDGAAVTISGTAGDAGGGVVAGVEVSTDGGTSWHPANGTTNWTYSWIAHGNPTTTIRSRAVDDSGNLGPPSAVVTVNVACPCSIFGTNMKPVVTDLGDAGSIEVGLKFRSDTFGSISGIRFYKSTLNTGTHVGNLWTAGGQLLASATFSGETATGWQQVNFSTPVLINPNTTYIASYFAPKGHYAGDENYFSLPQSPNLGPSTLDSAPLHALRDTAATANGVYSYGSSSSFPNQPDVADNYWIDVAFSPQAAPGPPTNVIASSGYASAGLTWTAPTSGGAVTTYTVTPFVGSTAQTPIVVSGTPASPAATVAGLTNGTTYTFTVSAANPNGTSAASAPSNAVTPSASASPLINGGFESGLGPWTAGGVLSPSVSTTQAHTGTHSALLGAVDPAPEPAGDSNLSQTLTVPTGSSQLTFWYWPQSKDALCSGSACTFDWETAEIRTTSGATLAQVFKSNVNAAGWTQVTFDTSPYAGQTVVLWFNVHGDGSSPPDDSWMYLDDVAVTVTGPPTVPAAPTGVAATAGPASASVSWAPPANGGSPITGYTITPYIGTAAQSPVQVTGSPPATSTVVTGLTAGSTYTFGVAGSNSVGTGAQSAASSPVTVAPATVPGTPTHVVATPGDTRASVTWTAPTNGGSSISSYTITASNQAEVGGSQVSMTVTGSPPATNATFPGLTNGSPYAFSVAATNSVGTGQSSTLSNVITPGTLPGAPTNVTATGGNSSATISWTAPPNGGDPLTSYTITPFVGSAAQVPTTVSGSPPTTTVTVAVNNGTTYTFQVAATNAIGTGPASAASNAVTPTGPTTPAAPTGVSAAPGDSSASVSWVAPGDGGSSITSYSVTPFVGTTAQPTTVVPGSPPGTSTVVSGLSNGTTYTFVVSATNAIGSGPASSPSGAVTPGPLPGAPTNVSALPGNGSATVAWTAPTTGGGGITSYTITPFVGSTPQPSTTASGSAVSATVTGLTNLTTYTFRVSATNPIGAGPLSSPSNPVAPRAAPPTCPCTIFGTAIPATVDSGDASGSVVLGVAFSSDTDGLVTGIRFYKAAANTGTHIGTLWSASGTALASATFSGETASGWQQVTFSSPVPVTAGTTYVASYLAPSGHYSLGTSFATGGTDNPPLHALPDGAPHNGLYVYSSTNSFPTSSFNSSNYDVDVTYVVSTVPGAPSGVTATAGNASATVSWIAPSSTGGSPITTYTVTPYIGPTAQPATTVPASSSSVSIAGLTNGTTYTFRVSASNSSGPGPLSSPSNPVAPSAGPPSCPCTIFATTTPGVVDSGDGSSVVLGVAFSSDVNGLVTGIRFYKSAANTGTHIGTLWSASGTALASATFSGETASGWQQVTFSSPVAITAGTTYIASYLAPSGHYADTTNAFTSAGIDRPPLHALAATSRPNGIYNYGTTNTFPTSTFNSSNYWVDVMFATAAVSAPGAPGGVVGKAGNTSATVSWMAPSSNGGSPITSYTITPFIGSTAHPATTASSSSVSATVTGLTNGTTYTFTLSATNSTGTGPGSTPSNPVTPQAAPPSCTCTVWGNSTPSTLDAGEGSSVVLGMAFSSDTDGFVTGVRFYKSAANTGTHVGTLWSVTGTALASATFSGESASGWQQVTFSSPVAVTAGTVYVASYLAPFGHFSFRPNAYGVSGVDTAPLHALASSSTPNGNGVYVYSVSNVFPTNTFNATDYGVDVVYVRTLPQAPTSPSNVVAVPGNTVASVSWSAPSSDGGSPITGYTVTPFVGSSPQPATTVSGSPPAVSATVTGLSNGTSYTFRVTANNAVGSSPASAPSNAVTPVAPSFPCPCTILGSTTPAVVDSGDTASVVLGVAFNAETNGYVTGIRFYKSASNVGTHIGTLWNASGISLATATFTGEAASGWQQVSFSSPVPITGGTTYVASYLAPSGGYSYTSGAFSNSGVNNPPLHALQSSAVPNGNGLYSYGTTNAFPTNTFNASNYFVDVVYSVTVPPATPAGVTATASGSGSATVSWTAPTNGGGPITSYTVTPFIGTTAQAATVVSGSPPATTVTVTGLTNGTTYTFKISATNAAGTGPQSSSSNAVTPTGPPAAPTGVSASPGFNSATVSWTAPSNGGSAITNYTVTPFIGTTPQAATVVSGSPPATTVTINGLSSGSSYTFRVSATNAAGTGAQSSPSAAITPCANLLCL